jgi:hypothetical protein
MNAQSRRSGGRWQTARKSGTAAREWRGDVDNERRKNLKPQAQQKHPDRWQKDLKPDHLAGQNIGRSEELG